MRKFIATLIVLMSLAACGARKLDDATARERLSAESIYVAEKTSLAGVREKSLAGFIKLKRYCVGDKPLLVTGGTEKRSEDAGGLTHAEGYKFDVPQENEPLFNAELEKLIKVRTGTVEVKPREQYTFWNESVQYRIRKEDGTHWDITVDAT